MFNIGVDIIEISRFAHARYPDRVAEFFLTPEEYSAAQNVADKHQFFASRFAVKEAVIKAMPEPIEFQEFEIIKIATKPKIRFLDNKFNKYQIAVSLSHSFNSAIGFAVVQF